MKFHSEWDGRQYVVRGIVPIQKEGWLAISPINEVTDAIFDFRTERYEGYPATQRGRELSALPVTITLRVEPRGVWNKPEYWFLETMYLHIRQTGTLNCLYNGPIVKGCSGDVYSKTSNLFTDMGFVRRFFQEEMKQLLEEEIDLWLSR